MHTSAKQGVGARSGTQVELEGLRQQVAELEQRLESVSAERDHAERGRRALAHLLGQASHELRTPLGALRLQLDRLWCNRKGGLGFKELELVNRCLRSTRRISDLVESLLEYAHIQRGQLELRSESFDLALLCGEVLDELEPLATQKGLEIAATLQTNKSFVRSDKVLVRLTLLNLMSNTVKHTEDGVVQVTLRADESYHGVSMANRRNPLGVRRLASALGNVPSGAARVQNDEARDDEFGLTLVREMIAALRGRVEIEAGEDGTSVVTVLIPSHQPTQ